MRPYEIEQIANPDWDNWERPRVHDWRKYVPGEYQDRWDELSQETREAIYAMAKEMADSEEWE